MKRNLCFIVSLLIALPFIAFTQVKVDTAIEYREKPDFCGLVHKCSAHVYLTQGDTQIIRIEADSAIIKRLRTDIFKESLLVWTQTNIEKAVCLNAHLTIKDLNYIESSGLGGLENSDTLKADTLKLVTKFFGGMKLNIDCNHLILEIGGSRPVFLAGKAKSCEINHTSTPLLDASGLEVDRCKITITYTGIVKLNAKREIIARISGDGGIYYLGEPDIIDKEISGKGFMVKL